MGKIKVDLGRQIKEQNEIRAVSESLEKRKNTDLARNGDVSQDLMEKRSLMWRWLKYELRQPAEWAENLGKKLVNTRLLKWAFGAPSREPYRFTLRDGRGSHKELVDTLLQMNMLTVDQHILRIAEEEVEKRNFSLTKQESTFLPVWVNGTRKPNNPMADNFLGTLFYTTRGVWLFVLDRGNFDSILDESESTRLPSGQLRGEYFRELFPRGNFGDVEISGRKPFKKITDKDYKQMVVDYYRLRLARAYKKSGTKEFQDIRLVETKDQFL